MADSQTSEGDAGPSRLPLRNVVHRRHHVSPPAHHVVQPSNTVAQSLRESLPLLPTLMPTQPEQLYCTERTSVFLDAGPLSTKVAQGGVETGNGYVRVGFQNPWDSWHKPTMSEVWNGLRWSQSASTSEMRLYERAIAEARQREGSEVDKEATVEPAAPLLPEDDLNGDADPQPSDMYAEDLQSQTPDWSQVDEDTTTVKATWLGHASVLLQLPPLRKDGTPIQVLFDPIFSNRCSPTQYVGPQRLYPAPCRIADLPPIHVVCISHSHYDHLDYDSIVQIWQANKSSVHFIVPLDNKAWFLGLGLDIDEELVTELDWWDETWLTDDVGEVDAASDANDESAFRLRVVCTPAQHGSGRYGLDAGRSLWSSWTVERTPFSTAATGDSGKQGRRTFRAFFGGDSGFQFHPSDSQNLTQYPLCPAFEEVYRVLGAPDLSFLPISVGATFNFVKSYDTFGLLPVVDNGLTGANHLTPFDAVRVAKILAGGADPYGDASGAADDTSRTDDGATGGMRPSVTMAIHWGTFVRGIEEVRQSMRDLKSACAVQDVEYVRQYDGREISTSVDQGRTTFACVDLGACIRLNV